MMPDVHSKVFGKIPPEAREFFKEAKERGLTTGIYTRSLKDIIEPYLRHNGLEELFDHVIGNSLVYKDSVIEGLCENIPSGKPSLRKDLEKHGLNPDDTAYIDDRDIEPLREAGMGFAAPSSGQEFRDKCKEYGIHTPDSWEEIGEILEI